MIGILGLNLIKNTNNVQIVGDDLYVTNPERFAKGMWD